MVNCMIGEFHPSSEQERVTHKKDALPNGADSAVFVFFFLYFRLCWTVPPLQEGGNDQAVCNAQVNRAQGAQPRSVRCYVQSLGDTCLPYHFSTTLLISRVFACVINNVYLEKSMCIIVFDLVTNFKAKDSIFFFNFQRGRMEIIWKLFSPLSSGDLCVNMVCMYVLLCDVYTYANIYTHIYIHTHTCILRKEL